MSPRKRKGSKFKGTDGPRKTDTTFQQIILERVKLYMSAADVDLIRNAGNYALEAHRGQRRRSGKPFVVHPFAVAFNLAQLKMDAATIAAALLHDVVEDTPRTLADIERRFGKEVAFLVNSLTNFSKIEVQSKEERKARNLQKMIHAATKDYRVLIIKLADRLNNLETLRAMPIESQERTARETLDYYVPMAARLGVYIMQKKLEDISFRYLEPERYLELAALKAEAMARTRPSNDVFRQALRQELEKKGFNFRIRLREKPVFSINRRMTSAGMEFGQIYDITAFQIFVQKETDCWKSLGTIHSWWPHIESLFKDYISMPRPNGYQSLHTTVITPEQRQILIQIRTHEMELRAEKGIIARAPNNNSQLESSYAQALEDARYIMEQHYENWADFLDSVRKELNTKRIVVLTPKGLRKILPEGSTPIDFAYHVSADLGHRFIGARVNGKDAPPDNKLRSGDVAEIIVGAEPDPKIEWLGMVKSALARALIMSYLEERIQQP